MKIDDNINPADTRSSLNLAQSLNTIAFVLRRITGQSSWKIPPNISLVDLSQSQRQPGPKGDPGINGEPGVKGDKGDKGDSAPLNHTHAIALVDGKASCP